jgi:ATP-dependent RNA helicase DDX27
MEASKAENIMVHHDEIVARPAKSWFQTEAEKKKLKGFYQQYRNHRHRHQFQAL